MTNIARDITRFSSKKVIDELFKKARRVIKHPGLHILTAPKASSFGHLLIIVPRKAGNAPERNKIRRRVKSIFYEEKLYQKDFDCIVIVKKEGIALPFTELRELLLKAFALSCPSSS
jgi:ribonuclease P protein component